MEAAKLVSFSKAKMAPAIAFHRVSLDLVVVGVP
jgi:hypothetical protein